MDFQKVFLATYLVFIRKFTYMSGGSKDFQSVKAIRETVFAIAILKISCVPLFKDKSTCCPLLFSEKFSASYQLIWRYETGYCRGKFKFENLDKVQRRKNQIRKRQNWKKSTMKNIRRSCSLLHRLWMKISKLKKKMRG